MGEFPAKISYTIPQAVEATGIGRTKLYEYIQNGSLRTQKAGRRTIIQHDELKRLVNSLPDSGHAA